MTELDDDGLRRSAALQLAFVTAINAHGVPPWTTLHALLALGEAVGCVIVRSDHHCVTPVADLLDQMRTRIVREAGVSVTVTGHTLAH